MPMYGDSRRLVELTLHNLATAVASLEEQCNTVAHELDDWPEAARGAHEGVRAAKDHLEIARMALNEHLRLVYRRVPGPQDRGR